MNKSGFKFGVHQPWAPQKNFGWLQGIVDSRKPVVLADTPTEAMMATQKLGLPSTDAPSFFKREIDYLIEKGYRYDPTYSGPGSGRLIPPEMQYHTPSSYQSDFFTPPAEVLKIPRTAGGAIDQSHENDG